MKLFLMIGSIAMFLAVALGAFGAHGLRERISADMLQVYQTGVQYHMVHALGILAVGILSYWLSPSSLLSWAGWLFFIGILLFSGSLYGLSVSGMRWLGAITPLGGLSFLLGWLLIALAAWRA